MELKVVPTKVAKSKSDFAKVKNFNHREHADRLDELNTQAQAARRVDVALGLYCFELKEIYLQPKTFGRWLAENRPHLAEKNNAGCWTPSKSLETAMYLAKSALENCNYKIGDYIELLEKRMSHAGDIRDSRQLMLLPDAKLPEEFKELREQIFALVDGKSQRQLISEFRQVEDGKVKRGRLKNSPGCTKEMRANAEELERQERITEKTLRAQEIADWLMEMSDDKGFGEIVGTAELGALDKAMETARGYIKRVGGVK